MVARTLSEMLGDLITRVGRVERRQAAAGGVGLPPRLAGDLLPILAGTDLNDIRATGFYIQSANANATLALNYPLEGRAGHLRVSGSTAGDDFVFQSYDDYLNARQWVRSYFNGTWTAWLHAIRDINSASIVLRMPGTGDASLTSTGHAFQIGPDTGTNVAFDNNEIMARNNGAVSLLGLNGAGGNVGLGDSTSTINLPGRLNATHLAWAEAGNNATITGFTAGTVKSVSVTFPSGRFTQPPILSVIVGTGNPNGQFATASLPPTASGATFYGYRGDSVASMPIQWTAKQMTSTSGGG